jgi:hypothetical protein
MGAEVTALVEPVLVDLFRLNFPDVEVVACSGRAEFQDPDYWIEWFSLPLRLGVTPANVPRRAYLRAPPTGPKPAAHARIGVATSGNPAHQNDAHRSLDRESAARVLSLPGAISLQPADSGVRSFAETAHLIANLDAVISVDTSVAHLAGAMGKRCLLLLPSRRPDWRWLAGGDDTPWYPTMRLVRQAATETWLDVVGRITPLA